ncbi:uncharacterized protein METZ01_LOCUS339191 [marine metagenome]|jgi:N-acetylglutamate synthase-like GNAT family acetyltransferase|uniref:N-acetyltransferase domain-containing protein n=1 Tax=marine metagenome TaxID=408172 RepID=A0A382QN14_9ZZZZ
MNIFEELPEPVKKNVKKLTNKDIDIMCQYKLTNNIEDIKIKLSSRSKNIIKLFTYTSILKKINGLAILKIKKNNSELLYLCSKTKGSGNGSKLLKKVEEITIQRGLKRISLEAHEDAIEFYKKKGYKSIDRFAKESMYKDLIKGKGNADKLKNLI